MSILTQTGSTAADSTAIPAHRLVKTAGAAVVTAAATDVPIGATTRTVTASEANFPYDYFGPTLLEASAAITKGALVQPAASGKIATRTGSNTIAGVAMQTASGDGHVIEVFMVPQGYASMPAIVSFDITVAAVVQGSPNTVTVTLQAVDQNGNEIAATIDGILTVYEATMIEAVAAEFTVADGGSGSLVSTTAQARVHFRTDSTGECTLTISDVGDDRDESIPFTVEALNLTNGTYIAFGKQLDYAVFATS